MIRVSIIEPYWRRPGGLRLQLEGLRDLWGDRTDLELIVVDDGSPDDPALPICAEFESQVKFPIECVSLPVKTVGKDNCLPFNVAARRARGEYLILTQADVTFTLPLIDESLSAIAKHGPKSIVFPCIIETLNGSLRTHQFASMPTPDCLVLRRDYYWALGGFPEEYRDGFAYSDCDLMWTARKAGAQFVCLVDCVVLHHSRFADPQKHEHPGWARNYALLCAKYKEFREGVTTFFNWIFPSDREEPLYLFVGDYEVKGDETPCTAR